MKKFLPFLIITVIIFAAGCSKSSNSPNKPGNGPTSGNQLVVSTVTFGYGSPIADTFSVTKYKYDAQNRVILTTMRYKATGLTDTDSYYYDTNGDLTKVIYQAAGGQGPQYKYSGVEVFTYNNGIPQSITTNDSYHNNSSLKYTVTNNKVTGYVSTSGPTKNCSVIYDGDNVKTVIYNAGVSPNVATTTVTNIFDSNKDIAYTTGCKWVLLGTSAPIPYAAQNEISSQSSITQGITNTNTLDYEHNSEGYPTKVTNSLNGKVFAIAYNTFADAK